MQIGGGVLVLTDKQWRASVCVVWRRWRSLVDELSVRKSAGREDDLAVISVLRQKQEALGLVWVPGGRMVGRLRRRPREVHALLPRVKGLLDAVAGQQAEVELSGKQLRILIAQAVSLLHGHHMGDARRHEGPPGVFRAASRHEHQLRPHDVATGTEVRIQRRSGQKVRLSRRARLLQTQTVARAVAGVVQHGAAERQEAREAAGRRWARLEAENALRISKLLLQH
eukprot:scaffold576_cov260-Pinguiococcus_pyrenoidosus.AAC.22